MRDNATLKIIAGHWRGRWIEFPDTQEIRPTPNRIRETVFNWLMKDIQGACCLDAFSGSGALAFEALSRGAARVLAFERNAAFATEIKRNAQKLKAENLTIQAKDFFFRPYP